MKPYLALFRSGPKSLHPQAVQRLKDQNFDYALSWFGDDRPEALGMAEGAAFVHMQKGAKWPGLEQTLIAHWEQIQQYRYVWLPDDDLLCVPEDVSRMFAICDELQLELAQPALTPDSYLHPPGDAAAQRVPAALHELRRSDGAGVLRRHARQDLPDVEEPDQRLRPGRAVAAPEPAGQGGDHRRHPGQAHPSGRRPELRLQRRGRPGAGARGLARLLRPLRRGTGRLPDQLRRPAAKRRPDLHRAVAARNQRACSRPCSSPATA